MASGDRIELLTAGTFETAMDAQEAILNNVSTKVNTINVNVEQSIRDISTAYTNLSNDISTVYQTGSANYGVLADLYNKIGVTNNTGGTATAGTMMGKLNTLINNTENIKASVGTSSLYSTIFIPTETNLLKTVSSTAVTVSNQSIVLGSFVSKYSGCICIKITGYIANVNASATGIFIVTNNLQSYLEPIYPSSPAAALSSSNYSNATTPLNFSAITPETKTMYLNVEAGKIYYFIINGSSLRPFTCQSVQLFGTTISYY